MLTPKTDDLTDRWTQGRPGSLLGLKWVRRQVKKQTRTTQRAGYSLGFINTHKYAND